MKNKKTINNCKMIKEIKIFMGEKEISPDEFKNYICINEYVSEIVNEIYYKYYPEKKD